MTSRDDIQKVVDAHWEYTAAALLAAKCDQVLVDASEYFYVESGVHFWKHAEERAMEYLRGMTSIDDKAKAAVAKHLFGEEL